MEDPEEEEKEEIKEEPEKPQLLKMPPKPANWKFMLHTEKRAWEK